MGGERGTVRPVVALVFATVGFLALAIFGLGMLSLATDEDVVVVAGAGDLPGVLGVIAAVGGFAGLVWLGVRADAPSGWSAFGTAAGAFLGYVAGVVVGSLLGGADPAAAVAAAGHVVVGGFAWVVAVAGLLAGLGAIVLVGWRGGRPRWPWERG